MGGTTSTANAHGNFSDDELAALQSLASLAQETTDYPLECSLGTCNFLLESRDDIEVILDHLSEEISASRKSD
jgi:hypothetical protein